MVHRGTRRKIGGCSIGEVNRDIPQENEMDPLLEVNIPAFLLALLLDQEPHNACSKEEAPLNMSPI